MQYCFERVEKKYVLTKKQLHAFMDRIAPHMMQDTYSYYTICNLYFDTEQFDLITHSLEKPPYKEKMRIRTYGTMTSNNPIFIELKKKYLHTVFKRRITCTSTQLSAFLCNTQMAFDDSQIAKEIAYFMQRYHPYPRLFIAYDRHAYKGIYEQDLRITFDENLRYRKHDLTLEKDYGKPYSQEDLVIMEIKVQNAFPLWLTHILNEQAIYPRSFSKYGNIYRNHIVQHSYKEERSYV